MPLFAKDFIGTKGSRHFYKREKEMNYPDLIWSQGWGSDAFLHLDNNAKLFGPLNFDFKKEFICNNFIPYAAISCNFIGYHRFCRDKAISDKVFKVLKSITFPRYFHLRETSWPYMESSTLPERGDLNWNGPKNFIDPMFYEIIKIKKSQKNILPKLKFT